MTSSFRHDLTLPEELLLLALDDESGAGRSDVALAGGILAELSFQGAVVISKQGRRTYVDAASSAGAMTDALLLECLNDITESRKRRDATHWVQKFSGKKDLKQRVAEPLVARGVLDERKRSFLFIKLTQFPELDPWPEAQMTERLRSAIEHDHVVPDDRTVTLAVIANAAGLLTKNLDKKMLRARKARLKDLADGEHVSKAVKAAIDAVNTAVLVAVTAGAVAAT